MGRGRKRVSKLSTAPVPYPTTVFQGAQAESDRKDLRRHQRERTPHSDLDSLDRTAVAEMAAPPLQSQLVLVQSGLHAAAQPVHLSRADAVASQSHGNSAATAGRRATHACPDMTWTGTFHGKGDLILKLPESVQ